MTPRLRFHGAARTVTGSCFSLETDGARVLIDCGMFQGSKSEKELNYRAFPFRPASVDAVLLTHAHIDHSGLLPKLVKHGFDGPIFATPATMDLCSVMLPDSAYIQESEVEQLNRRNTRRGRSAVTPIYTGEDAKTCLTQFRPVAYEEWMTVATGIRARYWNAGHLLGSASVEVETGIDGKSESLRILFSGDIGPDAKLLHPDPVAPAGYDFVLCESTYGNRDRQETTVADRRRELGDVVRASTKRGGALLIPSFAVERTQELLVDLVGLMNGGEVDRMPIIIDSPLATKATAIFKRHAHELEEGEALVRALDSPHVRFTESVEQSKALDRLRDFHIVIAASGMCEAGRIRYRLKNWLWRDEATVLFVGFQAEGTLGRVLLDGATAVRIQGEEIQVKADIRSLDLYSGHADAPELAAWVKARLPIRRGLFLVHGEEPSATGLRTRLSGILPESRVLLPKLDDVYELGPSAIELAPEQPRRMAPEATGKLDWHNELSKLLLDISDKVSGAPDERGRGVVIRRLRRALDAVERQQ